MAGQEPKQPKQAEQAEVIEEIEQERPGEEEDEEDLESYDEEEDMFDPMQELGRVLEPFNDTLQGILEALDKQNKILYKLASVVEAKAK